VSGIPGPSQNLETVGVTSLKRVVTLRMSWNISASASSSSLSAECPYAEAAL